jgi:hypothetical protein
MQQELDRKVLETLENRLRRRETGELSGREASVAAAALFGATAGLMSDETQKVVEDAYMQLGEIGPIADTRVYLKPDGSFAASVSWTPGTNVVHVLAGTYEQRSHACATPSEARDRFGKTIHAFHRHGLKRFGA